jgi:hypothetical protein
VFRDTIWLLLKHIWYKVGAADIKTDADSRAAVQVTTAKRFDGCLALHSMCMYHYIRQVCVSPAVLWCCKYASLAMPHDQSLPAFTVLPKLTAAGCQQGAVPTTDISFHGATTELLSFIGTRSSGHCCLCAVPFTTGWRS